jgi:hypothetical protein
MKKCIIKLTKSNTFNMLGVSINEYYCKTHKCRYEGSDKGNECPYSRLEKSKVKL